MKLRGSDAEIYLVSLPFASGMSRPRFTWNFRPRQQTLFAKKFATYGPKWIASSADASIHHRRATGSFNAQTPTTPYTE
jgi:hypothetical protein